MASDALLLGRVTYEGFAAAWPSREGEFADKFNGMQKYVVSSTLGEPAWNNSKVVSVDDIAGLRDAEGGDILVNGSAQLVAELLDRGLVDELRLMVFPTVLGGGRRLFGDTAEPKAFKLVEARPVGPDGVVVLSYQPVTRED
jgi:dihydrofolate reductase